MKNFLFLLLAAFVLSPVVHAQKVGYIDSNFILSKMPAYNQVQQEMDKYAENWQREIEELQKELNNLKQDFKAEEVLLTEQMKSKRQADISKKETEVREYQRKVFGYEGMMFKRRQDLIRPIQDEVFTAVEKVSKAKGIQIMFDKSGDLVMIYTNPVHDYTEYVLESLGLVSEKQNKQGAQPVESIIDNPEDLPDTEIIEQEQESVPARQQNVQPKPALKKKSNN